MNKLEEKFKDALEKRGYANVDLINEIKKITEQECIEFKSFCDKLLLIRTDKEMFELYLKSKENE